MSVQRSETRQDHADKASLPWWHKLTAYQIWPRSFSDSNGDGVGDIPGIISKLDYLADLGIGLIWLSPINTSPMVDMGYDISDYQDIAPEFGTLEDFDRLIAEAKARGIGIMMDLVINHSSDQHAWFRRAAESRDAPEHDYYIWRDPNSDGGPPDDLSASFGGPMWNWVEAVGQYYYSFFSASQPDLNWQNPRLRQAVYEMMNWWLDRGIVGFRLDAIGHIGKQLDAGIFENGPDLHRFLREMNEKTFAGRETVTVGEAFSASTDEALQIAGRDRHELDMVFQFTHINVFQEPEIWQWQYKPFDLVVFKRELFSWQRALEENGWNTQFLSNHDLPRQVSIYGDAVNWRVRSAKMLATVMHLMRGTPFVYQGEEIGMTNVAFSELEQFRDIALLGNVEAWRAEGRSLEEILVAARKYCRDNARTPVQWSPEANAGFTSGTPWIEVNGNFREINVQADRADPDGVFAHYKRLIGLRRTLDIISLGRFAAHAESDPSVIAYSRETDTQRLSVLANFTDRSIVFPVPQGMEVEGECIIHNVEPREAMAGALTLAPFEAFAVLGNQPQEEAHRSDEGKGSERT